MRWCVSPRPPVPSPPTSSRPRCRHPGIRFASLAPAKIRLASSARSRTPPPSRSFSSPPPRGFHQDVLGDGSILKRDRSGPPVGTGRRPSVGDAVDVSVLRRVAPGTPRAGAILQDAAFAGLVIGDGTVCRGVELALETMLEGESATFALRLRHLPPDAAYPEEATLRLVRIREETDLVAEHFPPPSSRRLLERRADEPAPPARAPPVCSKRRVAWGEAKTIGSRAHEGGRPPRDRDRDEDGDFSRRRFFERDVGRRVARRGCVVRVALDEPLASRARAAGAALPPVRTTSADDDEKNENAGVEPVGDVVLGDGAVAEALELALFLASPGERFFLAFDADAFGRADAADEGAVADAEATEKQPSSASSSSSSVVSLGVEVVSVSPPPRDSDVAYASPEARLAEAKALKLRGAALCRAGRFRAALRACDACAHVIDAPFAPRRAADLSRGDKEALTKEKTAAAAPGGTALEDPSRKQKIPLSNPWRGVRDECPLTRQANLLNASLAASGAGLDARCAEYCSSLLREIDPRCVKALFRRARALANLGRFDDAEDDLGYAERLEPHLKTREGGALRRAIRDARAREDDARGAARGGASLERAFERVFGGGGVGDSGDGSEKKKTAAEKRKAHERGERFEDDPNDARGGEEPRMQYASEAALYLGPGASEADRALFREGNKGGGDKGASGGSSSKFADQPSHTDAFNANGLDALEPDEPTREDRCRFAVRRAAELEEDFERTYKASSGLPFELYADAERAPAGEAFPTAKAVARGDYLLRPDFAAIEAEVAAEERKAESQRRVGVSADRGFAARRSYNAGISNPWDRDGKKAEAEMEASVMADMEEAARRERKEAAEAWGRRREERRDVATRDCVDVD